MLSPEKSTPPPARRKHPLPGFCWVWVAGILYMAWVALAFLYGTMNPGESWAGQEWKLGIISGLFAAGMLGYAAFWFCFAIKQKLTRRIWHTGTGLILAGAMMLFVINQTAAGIIFLLVLAVWTQGLTRKHFDRT